MAKNKNNRDRKQSQSARAPQAAESAVLDREEQHAPPLSPGDAASRKRQKRFGHN
ncbi:MULTISPECIES: hypothetical protein [Streptomyces]|jgi:hypothetical protein|uniref:hypothetical protein n=1 Tax=Streptomyces TaxID=1883 RepID=UPI0016718794|nr:MULTISPECIES: hypothetical protein [Streptomyces]MCG8971178.1 hypothetical protein [Streptomyces sp. CL12-4]GGQ47520.1 hypothetical protein GCM10010216_04880 [Streptomyces flaveolus]